MDLIFRISAMHSSLIACVLSICSVYAADYNDWLFPPQSNGLSDSMLSYQNSQSVPNSIVPINLRTNSLVLIPTHQVSSQWSSLATSYVPGIASYSNYPAPIPPPYNWNRRPHNSGSKTLHVNVARPVVNETDATQPQELVITEDVLAKLFALRPFPQFIRSTDQQSSSKTISSELINKLAALLVNDSRFLEKIREKINVGTKSKAAQKASTKTLQIPHKKIIQKTSSKDLISKKYLKETILTTTAAINIDRHLETTPVAHESTTAIESSNEETTMTASSSGQSDSEEENEETTTATNTEWSSQMTPVALVETTTDTSDEIDTTTEDSLLTETTTYDEELESTSLTSEETSEGTAAVTETPERTTLRTDESTATTESSPEGNTTTASPSGEPDAEDENVPGKLNVPLTNANAIRQRTDHYIRKFRQNILRMLKYSPPTTTTSEPATQRQLITAIVGNITEESEENGQDDLGTSESTEKSEEITTVERDLDLAEVLNASEASTAASKARGDCQTLNKVFSPMDDPLLNQAIEEAATESEDPVQRLMLRVLSARLLKGFANGPSVESMKIVTNYFIRGFVSHNQLDQNSLYSVNLKDWGTIGDLMKCIQ